MKKNVNRIAFFNFLSVLLLQGISLISAPLFSGLLGTTGYGDLASFTVWANLMTTVFSLQSNLTIVNARQEYSEQEQPGYQSSVMTLSLLCFAAAGVLMMVFSRPLSAALKMSRLMLVLMLLQALGAFGVNFLHSKFTYEFKADKNMLLSVFLSASNLGVSLLLVLNMPQEQRYYGRVLGTVLTTGIIGLIACISILLRGRKLYDFAYWKFCFVLGWPQTFQALAYYLLGNSDVVMLRQMTGADVSGIYSLAFTVGGVMYTLYTAINNSWVPFFFDDMKMGRRDNVIRQGRNYLELYTVLSIGFVLLVPEVFRLFIKEDFWQGILLIPFFTANYYCNTLCTFPVNYDIHYKKTWVLTAGTISATLINLALNYVMIRAWGMVGAAVATLISRLIQLAMHQIYARCILGKRDYPFSLGSELEGIAALTLAIVLFYLTPNAWFIRWPLGAAVGVWELLRIWKRRSLF